MGIRFRCHHCENELHVKDFQAGKRGKCPKCEGKFRVPPSDAPHSLPADGGVVASTAQAAPIAAHKLAAQAAGNAPSAVAEEVDSVSAPLADARSVRPPIQGQNAGLQDVTALPRESDSVRGDVARSSTGDKAPIIDAKETAPPPPVQQFVPAVLDLNSQSTWYVRIADGSQFGPATGEILLQWLAENRIQKESLVWRDGWEQWRSASQAFADYFENRLAAGSGTNASELQASPDEQPDNNSESLTTNSLIGTDNKRLERKRRRKKNYTLAITFLTIAAVLLIVALIIVLILQQQ